MPFKNPLTRFPATGIIGVLTNDQIPDEFVSKIFTGGLFRTAVTGVRWEISTDLYGQNVIAAPSDDTDETYPAKIVAYDDGTTNYIEIRSSIGSGGGLGFLRVERDHSSDNGRVFVDGQYFSFGGMSVIADEMRATDTGDVAGTTTTTSGTGVQHGASVVTTAPISGAFKVSASVTCRTSNTAAVCVVECFVRTGSTVGSGTLVANKRIAYQGDTTWSTMSGTFLASGLTYGNSYNVTFNLYTTNTTYSVTAGVTSVLVEPSM